MKKIKYTNKKFLCEYDLSFEFFNELGIRINDISPLRKIFILYTDEGNKILKKVDCSIERVSIITDSLDYIKKKYKNVVSFNKFSDGLNYKVWNKDIYVVMDIIEGHECSFSNPIEIKICAENIALLHNASLGLREFLEKKYLKDMLDISLVEKFQNSYEQLLKLKNLVSSYKYKNEFDSLFIENVDKYLEEIAKAKQKLINSPYDKLRNSTDKISICHNDLAYRNFLINDKEANILDFDFMTIDLRIVDLSDFILKAIKNVAFDIEKMIIAIDAYEKINKLSREEKELLNILLEFPRDFYVICRDYYYKRKAWDYEVFLNRLQMKLDNEPFRYEFLEIYKSMLNEG